MDLNWTQESHGDILTDHDDKNSKEERTKKKKKNPTVEHPPCQNSNHTEVIISSFESFSSISTICTLV